MDGGIANTLVQFLFRLGAQMASLVALMAPNIRFSRRIARSPSLRAAS